MILVCINRRAPPATTNVQELERISQELNMSDEQQRAFMMKASMKKLAKATTLPRRQPRNPVKEAVKERVFQSEKGFLQNSKVRATLFRRHDPRLFLSCVLLCVVVFVVVVCCRRRINSFLARSIRFTLLCC